MKILFIGGYGNISWFCTKKSIEKGHEVYLLCRDLKTGTRREIPKEAKIIKADIRNIEATKEILKNYNFDVVCDFLCYNKEHAKNAINLFENKTKQYIYISSDSVYKTPDKDGLFRETSIKYNVGESSDYINGKLEAEIEFMNAYKNTSYPITIVRPGYTYDTIMPYSIGHNCFTTVKRCLEGKALLIAGNGDNLWTFTHSRDFADAFVELFGRKECIGEDYQLSGNCVETFNKLMRIELKLLGLNSVNVIHIPYEAIEKHEEFSPKDMLHRYQNRIFDTSKIKKIATQWSPNINIEKGLQETINWFNENEKRKRFSEQLDNNLENLTNEFKQNQKEIKL